MDKSQEPEQTSPVVEFERKINDEAFEIASWVSLLKTMQRIGENKNLPPIIADGDKALKALCLTLSDNEYDKFLSRIKKYSIEPLIHDSAANHIMANRLGFIDADGPKKELVYAVSYLVGDREDIDYLNQDYSLDKLDPYINLLSDTDAEKANSQIEQMGKEACFTTVLEGTRANAQYYIEEYFHQDNA